MIRSSSLVNLRSGISSPTGVCITTTNVGDTASLFWRHVYTSEIRCLGPTSRSKQAGQFREEFYSSFTCSLRLRKEAVRRNGVPQNNVKVNFTVVSGTGALSAASAQTNSSGYATVTLTATPMAAPVQVTACVAPGNVPCQTLYANPVPLAQQNLQPVAGAGQVSTGGRFSLWSCKSR